MLTPIHATQLWCAWTGAIWAQQIKMSQILLGAMAQSSAEAFWGVKMPMNACGVTPGAAPRKAAAPGRRKLEAVPAEPRRSARRQPSVPPGLPPRKGHATPV
ncbi:hypothetical protein SAMN05421853_102317 [Roseivivax halotolerans]|uniref:Uncharacterized protein n=1 Tax=Roseivivax halotolerans TaxID=93684 RepID=A0A1I5WFH5_9RHOB|nr:MULTISPECIES: hypothetical protein [Roseivivax]QFT64211.1 hypothetical protein FIU91_14830 [Roseivivax sp. THAF30]SFQ18490.1 hypothetical protein SAMN05421853_102317 [Roseivivax halotolerans]